MNDVERYAQQLKDARQTSGYWIDLAKLEFAEGIRMAMGNMSQAELAKKLGNKSAAYASRLLAGEYNFTIRRMNEIANLLDAAVHVYVAKRDVVVEWPRTETATVTIGDADESGLLQGAYHLRITVPIDPMFEPPKGLWTEGAPTTKTESYSLGQQASELPN